mmetsp:Transcript_16563/g.33343  ORF Transcript_16563/g.33343 Transcript_16563/m.33343 type:complete len:122 (-) Transcript_16563:72-437(-)|eukprot:CAMPEP_0113415912 /NCGR_PEP_ID=MMETSP0013_2-20120614/24835_1 /TAXON_ID=2843 ORGANISM="Skeletonema costatum, Strain 1716" /NCGR_SAMPLE_ID=MMETSP0013_2 /ASSEMBLY_ACC=CAM_ASM_000158 /LENGTH=121 /DNA_ID=CAMNT_0000302931 /DNA_START=197 /DNA_END=562 /DNA_ORIENTATION=+ /assembly_acc=CAM_ASM_000158
MVDTKEIQLRIDTLKATAFTDGVESTEGLWMVLQENAKAKKTSTTPFLRELLGISEDDMVQQFGERWRGKVKMQDRGFIHGELSECVFASVQDSYFESSIPIDILGILSTMVIWKWKQSKT